MNVSTFKAVLCTAGLSKVEPAFEKFPVSYGSVLAFTRPLSNFPVTMYQTLC